MRTSADNRLGYHALEHCRVCGADVDREFRVFRDEVPDEETGTGVYRIVVCGRCGHGNTDPLPDDETIRSLYAGENHDYELPGPGPIERLKDELSKRFMSRIISGCSAPVRTILDYGTGGGRYAAAAARACAGARVAGVDFAQTAPANSYYQLNPGLRYLSYANLGEERFDLVLVRHVLEHVREPVAFLRSMLERTTDSGAVYVEVPNLRSRTAQLVGVRWPLYFVPRHVSHFTAASLERVIDAAGGEGRIRRNEMPLMSNVLGIRFGSGRYDDRFKLPGIVFHPVQLALEASAGESTCLWSLVRRKGSARV